jgi:hypothetical protein
MAISLVFVYRSFYAMRITQESTKDQGNTTISGFKDKSVPELVEEAAEVCLSN